MASLVIASVLTLTLRSVVGDPWDTAEPLSGPGEIAPDTVRDEPGSLFLGGTEPEEASPGTRDLPDDLEPSTDDSYVRVLFTRADYDLSDEKSLVRSGAARDPRDPAGGEAAWTLGEQSLLVLLIGGGTLLILSLSAYGLIMACANRSSTGAEAAIKEGLNEGRTFIDEPLHYDAQRREREADRRLRDNSMERLDRIYLSGRSRREQIRDTIRRKTDELMSDIIPTSPGGPRFPVALCRSLAAVRSAPTHAFHRTADALARFWMVLESTRVRRHAGRDRKGRTHKTFRKLRRRLAGRVYRVAEKFARFI
ncbi:hypothetical protein [Kiritimatiella glycovorans]|nr:hypothetical protein [Kiritimatiella glycovorans]